MHLSHEAPVAAGIVAGSIAAIVPDGVVSLGGKLLVAVITGVATGLAVKAGGALFEWLAGRFRRPRS